VVGYVVFSYEKPLEGNVEPYRGIIVQENTLKSYQNAQNINIIILANKIIECESGGRPDVCSYAGCGQGMGLFQLIPSTVKYCEKKLGHSIDPFNAEDNYECGMWLLQEEGTRHWGFSGATWGSYDCWSDYKYLVD